MDHNVWSAYLKNWTGASFADALSAYPGPVHLLYGAEDALVTAEYLGTTAAGLPDAELVRIDEAGHYPMLEQSVRTVRLWESALLNA
jgi:pimeloyl-ACP methyl ester carboxylesterase